GAGWLNPSDFLKPSFTATVTIGGRGASLGLIRYLLVAEVTEMFMASQRQGWVEPTDLFNVGDEGSMGEGLSRFLGVQFLIAKGISSSVLSGFAVVPFWLNSMFPTRPNFIDAAIDDNRPNQITGCATCFLFYLHDQLNFGISQIISAGAGSLAVVYTILTGKTDAWTSFKNLVDLHYPQDGSQYM